MNRKSKQRLARSQRRYANRHNRSKPVEAYFPLVCDECGFTAHGPNEMEHHDHDTDCFSEK